VLQKKILQEGQGDETPPTGSNVKVHYTGTLLDGTKFDSSKDRNQPFEFKLGKGQVIKGWDTGVATMKKGERAVLTCKPEYAYGKAGSPPKIPANATLQFEVDLIDWEEDETKENVTDDGGVTKKTSKEGEGYEKPEEGGTASVSYKAFAGDAKLPFEEKNQYTIELDSPNLIEGLAEALKSMTKNEKARVWIKSDYGYGAKGNKQLNVPPNANLIYEIELQSFENEKPSSDLKESEKIERGQKRKDLGNIFFRADNNRRAVKAYEGVISLFSDLLEFKEEKAKASALKATAYANVAAVKLKEKDWSAVIEQSTKALELDQKNPKVLFRRAQAQAHRGENPLALEDIKQALEIEPTNAAVIKLRNAIQSRITKQKEKEKKLFGGFFNKVKLVDDSELPTSPTSTENDKNENTANVENTTASEELQTNGTTNPTISTTTSSSSISSETKDESKELETKQTKSEANEETVSPTAKETLPQENENSKKKTAAAKKKKISKGSKPKAQKSKLDSDSSRTKASAAPKAKKEKSK